MTPIFGDVFTEMAVLLLVATVIAAIGMRLRQPLIVAFIAVGILVGPSALGWVSAMVFFIFYSQLDWPYCQGFGCLMANVRKRVLFSNVFRQPPLHAQRPCRRQRLLALHERIIEAV